MNNIIIRLTTRVLLISSSMLVAMEHSDLSKALYPEYVVQFFHSTNEEFEQAIKNLNARVNGKTSTDYHVMSVAIMSTSTITMNKPLFMLFMQRKIKKHSHKSSCTYSGCWLDVCALLSYILYRGGKVDDRIS